MIRWWKHIAVFTSKLAALIVLLIGSFSQNAFAAQTGCAMKIQEAVQALNADTQGLLISDEERSQIQKIFEDPQKRSFAAGYVFDLLMDKRLALLPLQDAAKIREVIQKAKVKHSSKFKQWLKLSNQLNGGYNPRSQSVTAVMPDSYRGSIVEFFVKTHEIEHAIQGLVAARAIGKNSLNYFQSLLTVFDSKILFVEEAGAMQAEWQYLQAIPADVKKSIIREIRRNPHLSKSDKDWTTRVLSSPAQTAYEHLQLERKAGRYTLVETQRISHDQIRDFVFSQLEITIVGVASPLEAVAWIESSCLKLLERSVMFPDGQFYRKICLKFQSVQEQQAARFPTSQPLLPTESHN